MAKIAMMCPFSRKLCKECAIYRGRHYYLCFSKEYRGYVGEPGGGVKEVGSHHKIKPGRKGTGSIC